MFSQVIANNPQKESLALGDQVRRGDKAPTQRREKAQTPPVDFRERGNSHIILNESHATSYGPGAHVQGGPGQKKQ